MKKIEMVWREVLFQIIEKKKEDRRFTQKDLAESLGISTSTIFQALKVPRRMGAVRVTGRFFTVEDWEKLLYHWASVRNFEREVFLQAHVSLPVFEIEGLMPPDVVFGFYSAARTYLPAPPADYDRVYVYAKDLIEIKRRFELGRGRVNLVVLRSDPLITGYGTKTTLAQTFVDLWNLADWQAKDFTRALKEKIDGLLS
ncbi:winged helix-turn-helix domain-containing protein [Candidatus Curtissbacteria bacterium]|nr:winged helix-turn-helix domain-containing protein [Candidatus Curtissbacteria bacterium]